MGSLGKSLPLLTESWLSRESRGPSLSHRAAVRLTEQLQTRSPEPGTCGARLKVTFHPSLPFSLLGLFLWEVGAGRWAEWAWQPPRGAAFPPLAGSAGRDLGARQGRTGISSWAGGERAEAGWDEGGDQRSRELGGSPGRREGVLLPAGCSSPGLRFQLRLPGSGGRGSGERTPEGGRAEPAKGSSRDSRSPEPGARPRPAARRPLRPAAPLSARGRPAHVRAQLPRNYKSQAARGRAHLLALRCLHRPPRAGIGGLQGNGRLSGPRRREAGPPPIVSRVEWSGARGAGEGVGVLEGLGWGRLGGQRKVRESWGQERAGVFWREVEFSGAQN